MKKLLVPVPIIRGQNNPGVEAELPDLYSAIQQLRYLIEVFQQHGFAIGPKARRLTIQKHTYNDPSLYGSKPNNRTPVPQIRIMGRWLQELGFKPYDHVRIIGLKELLIVYPEMLLPDTKEKVTEKKMSKLITMEQLLAG